MLEAVKIVGSAAVPFAMFGLFLKFNHVFYSEGFKYKFAVNWFSFFGCLAIAVFIFFFPYMSKKTTIGLVVFLNNTRLSDSYVFINGSTYNTDANGFMKIPKDSFGADAIIDGEYTYCSWKKSAKNDLTGKLFFTYKPSKVQVYGKDSIEMDRYDTNNYTLTFLNENNKSVFIDSGVNIKLSVEGDVIEHTKESTHAISSLSFNLDGKKFKNNYQKIKVSIVYDSFNKFDFSIPVYIRDKYDLNRYKDSTDWVLSKGSLSKVQYNSPTRGKESIDFLSLPKGYYTLRIEDGKIYKKISNVKFSFSRQDRMMSPHLYIENYVFTFGGDYGETITQHGLASDKKRISSSYKYIGLSIKDAVIYNVSFSIKRDLDVEIYEICIVPENDSDKVNEKCVSFDNSLETEDASNLFGIGATYTHSPLQKFKDKYSAVSIYKISKI